MVSPFAGNIYKGYYTITEGKNNLKINVSYEAQAADKFFLYIFRFLYRKKEIQTVEAA